MTINLYFQTTMYVLDQILNIFIVLIDHGPLILVFHLEFSYIIIIIHYSYFIHTSNN
jgi:hypothetical protein